MKARLFVIFIMFHFVSYGQTCHSLVDTNKLWSNLHHTHTGGPPPYTYETHFIKFNVDTVIESKTYKKVFITYDSTQTAWSTCGYIREDSNSKVYFLGQLDSVERLLYDFNLLVGDTFIYMFNSVVPIELLVYSVDSVFIYDKYVKRITFLPWETWYEGIGSSCGVLSSGLGGIVGSSYDLLCYYENDTLKYMNPDFNDCFISMTVGNVDDYNTNQIKAVIFPNPVVSTSILKVENMRDKKVVLEIYSLLGQRLMTTEIGEQTTINNSDFESGIYIYKIVTSSFVWTGKFQIE